MEIEKTKTMYVVMDGDDLCIAFDSKKDAEDHTARWGGFVSEEIIKYRPQPTFKFNVIPEVLH